MHAANVRVWSEWLNAAVTTVHACNGNADEDVGVLDQPAGEQGDAGWYLAITWRATDEDVAAGKAPEVNGILSAVQLKVCFCPFCGSDLVAETVA